MSKFASNTSVPASRSQAEIQRTLERYGAKEFMFGQAPDKVIMAFQYKERAIRIQNPLPPKKIKERWGVSDVPIAKWEQQVRQRFRCLLLIVKAKLEAVESGIVTVEEEFMPYLIMPDGRTVAEHSLPMIHQAYADGRMPRSIFGDNGQRLLTEGK